MRFLRNMILAIGFAGVCGMAACASSTPAEKTTPDAPKSTDPCATEGDPCGADVEKASPSIRGTDPCGGNPCNDK
jgi:hypothetical protein